MTTKEQQRLDEVASAMIAGFDDNHAAMEELLDSRRFASYDSLVAAYNLGQAKAALALHKQRSV